MVAADVDVGHFERRAADELADTRIDPIEAAKDHHRGLGACRDPTVCRFERFEDIIEPFPEVAEHVVVIERDAVVNVIGGGASADQNCVRDHLLQMGSGGEDVVELGRVAAAIARSACRVRTDPLECRARRRWRRWLPPHPATTGTTAPAFVVIGHAAKSTFHIRNVESFTAAHSNARAESRHETALP